MSIPWAFKFWFFPRLKFNSCEMGKELFQRWRWTSGAFVLTIWDSPIEPQQCSSSGSSTGSNSYRANANRVEAGHQHCAGPLPHNEQISVASSIQLLFFWSISDCPMHSCLYLYPYMPRTGAFPLIFSSVKWCIEQTSSLLPASEAQAEWFTSLGKRLKRTQKPEASEVQAVSVPRTGGSCPIARTQSELSLGPKRQSRISAGKTKHGGVC